MSWLRRVVAVWLSVMLLVAAVPGLSLGAGGTAEIPVTDDASWQFWGFTGTMLPDGRAAVRAGQGALTQVRFTGTGATLVAVVDGPTILHWRIDGGEWQRLEWNARGTVRIPVVSGLTPGEHTLAVRRAEGELMLLALAPEQVAPPTGALVQERFGAVAVTWQPAAGIQSYEVLRWTDAAPVPGVVATTGGASFLDLAPPRGVRVHYAVRGWQTDGQKTGLAVAGSLTVAAYGDWIRVSGLRGTAQAASAGGAAVPLAPGSAVRPGDQVTVGDGGWLELEFAGRQAVRLDEGARLTIAAHAVEPRTGKQETRLGLEAGRAFVRECTPFSSRFEVQAGGYLLRHAGTATYGVEAAADGVRAWVLSGELSTQTVDGPEFVTLRPSRRLESQMSRKLGKTVPVLGFTGSQLPPFFQVETVKAAACVDAELLRQVDISMADSLWNRAWEEALQEARGRVQVQVGLVRELRPGDAAAQAAAGEEEARLLTAVEQQVAEEKEAAEQRRAAAIAAEQERQRRIAERGRSRETNWPIVAMVSANPKTGEPGDDYSGLGVAISQDGRYVAFGSEAGNLVENDTNGAADVFVLDRQTRTLTRVSVASDGTEAAGPSWSPAISADGRFVAFASWAANLVEGDTNGTADIFVHDRKTGLTERVNVASDGAQANGSTYTGRVSISADGRYVAFASSATQLVEGDTNGVQDVFVHDRQTGETTRVSVDSAGNQANGTNSVPWISSDGRYVAFTSRGSNLVAGDTNGQTDVFVHDRQTGQTTRVSVATGGIQAAGGTSWLPTLSADGRYVTFESRATNLVDGDTNGVQDVFVHDRQTGATTRVSTVLDSSPVLGEGGAFAGAISADWRYVAFSAFWWDGEWYRDEVLVWDRETGLTTRASEAADGTPAGSGGSHVSLSGDGRWVAFLSISDNLVPGDTNGVEDVFVVKWQALP